MHTRPGILRTRVARRVFFLFIVGALIPVLAMAAMPFFAVNGQLEEQAEERLRQLANNAGQSIIQQLLLTQSGLLQVANTVENAEQARALAAFPPAVEGASVVDAGGAFQSLIGSLPPVPALTAGQLAHLGTAQMVLVAETGPTRLLAAVALNPDELEAGILWASLTPDSIWGPADTFTDLWTRSDFCILDESGEALYCSSGSDELPAAFRTLGLEQEYAGIFPTDAGGAASIAGYRTFGGLGAAFASPDWTVILSEVRSDVYAPLSSFAYTFPLALMLGLATVGLLASVQIRRTMGPLDALTAGTERIARGDFESRVEVTTRDEFGTLAEGFNSMAERIGLQVTQLQSANAIDRAVLGAMDLNEVVQALLRQFGAVVPSRSVAVFLIDARRRGRGTVHHAAGTGKDDPVVVELDDDDLEWLRAEPHFRIVPSSSSAPRFLSAERGSGPDPRGGKGTPGADAQLVVLPFMIGGQVRGALSYVPAGTESSAEEIGRARQIADQATVALDALRLVAELEDLSWGTLRAFARAIDAKSKWTAGHSERVTELALAIGREMGLNEADLDLLHRGGLLHDIGKIGVSSSILDSPNKLTPEERKAVEQHPVIGGRILAPIRAFRNALPIVTQHHERWEGGGYPDGVAGEDIHPLARILAVADVYDAMASERPYRGALDPGFVLRVISEERGAQFEPVPVDAFLRHMAHQGFAPQSLEEVAHE